MSSKAPEGVANKYSAIVLYIYFCCAARILDWKGDVELAVPDSGKTLLMLAAEHGELHFACSS